MGETYCFLYSQEKEKERLFQGRNIANQDRDARKDVKEQSGVGKAIQFFGKILFEQPRSRY